uniref:NADH dehydrogenase subunit 6 n=1 Tax=Paraleonnates uschakovi TaxID=1922336 RepID=A0A343A8R1_9ANNE|nr:NADH dehydrogenase subunit 6 [Paraleonnates uschakovi]APG32411.1 NADH dehydrogenase subunit 6 [Paraleonnates uschakovi]
MMLFMISTLMVTLISSTVMCISPISLGTLILTSALSISALISMSLSSWFGLITFIIYVGGMLVMFAYFAALQPNQHITNWSWALFPLTLSIMMFSLSSKTPMNLNLITPKINLLLTPVNMPVFIALSLLLFLILIAVVKTSRSREGPLRPFYV